MSNAKKFLFSIFIMLLVGGSAYGAYVLLKKYVLPQDKTSSTEGPAQLSINIQRDLSNAVPAVLPKDLVLPKNIKTTIESFSTDGASNKQYTFRYVSALDFNANVSFFRKFLESGNWSITNILSFKSNDFYSISGKSLEKQELFITINNTPANGVIVDITYTE